MLANRNEIKTKDLTYMNERSQRKPSEQKGFAKCTGTMMWAGCDRQLAMCYSQSDRLQTFVCKQE